MASTSSGDSNLYADAGPQILGAITSTWAVALIVLILRFVARRISRVGFWADDWLVLAAFVSYPAEAEKLDANRSAAFSLGGGRSLRRQ